MKQLTHLDEATIEKQLIQLLGEGHNQWTYRPDLKSEEDLWQNLKQKIMQNNTAEIGEHPLTDKEFEKIQTELSLKTQTPTDAAKWLRGENGVARIKIDREDAALGSMSLVLYRGLDVNGGQSSYEVVNQIAKKRDHIEARDRRFDVTLLMNGLPIIQIELKTVTAKDGVFQAFEQIKKYAEEGLFHNNIFATLQLFVISNEKTTRYFANALPEHMQRKYIFSWRTTDNKKIDSLNEFSRQVLSIPAAHRMITDYTVISEVEDTSHLLVLHSYQIHAIEAIHAAAIKRQSGYIWHATGSGKTLTSFVVTKLLTRATDVGRTIMLVDRTDLDNQTTDEFTKFASEYNTGISSGKGKANTLIVGTGNSTELSRVLLSEANSSVIIITTRQKLEAALKKAEKLEKEKGTNRFEKLTNEHIVFIVDECHRAVSAENMKRIKEFFPKSTWFGFTGTPIFEVNKKQVKGELARTTEDQYGKELHTYTIKNALDDGAVLAFQLEHENTLNTTTLDNKILNELRRNEKYANKSVDNLNKLIDQMDGITKETYLDAAIYESDDHIQTVIRKIFKPDNAYTKFDFAGGRPTKSAILTTSSIAMAKRYYKAIKEMTKEPNWMEKEFAGNTVRAGRAIDDPDFPRIAITYSLEENKGEASKKQDEMNEIIADYNDYYGTKWSASQLNAYNSNINERLARDKAEFKQFGEQVDLVIVVDRLLTGFNAPTIQTLFVDRHLEYAGLIQAFSRTNRTFLNKTKGLIVTFRKPHTMKKNVDEATELYSKKQENVGLIYPTYEESRNRFKKAYEKIEEFSYDIDEHTDLEVRIDYVKAFQELNNSFEALVTYDDYNDEIDESVILQNQVSWIEEQVGRYETVKGSLVEIEEALADTSNDFTEIEFYEEDSVMRYDIDSAYIDHLLGNYSVNNTDIRADIERALQKLNKSNLIKGVYRAILDAIDVGEISEDADIFEVKRQFFTDKINTTIHEFAAKWIVSEEELDFSSREYSLSSKELPNMNAISKSRDFKKYKSIHPEANAFAARSELSKEWKEVLDEIIVPLKNELR